MKMIGAVGLMALAAACSSTKSTGPDVAATDNSNTGVSSIVAGSQEDLEQNVGHRVFFGYDQYSLTPQAQATLQRQADFLKQHSNVRVVVSGNCDERGTREYNLALGARRAEAARAYLVSMGIDSSRVTAVSYGKERPIDPRSTEEAWSLNRNATTTISAVGA
ncbi:MAG: peptidoglycan-associated lipoprotein Pal [Parvularculaceae bacterium]|nr:peptidoglycan-associated lipoprotein Pal [Parvularculaceae bacterium]